MLRIERRGPCTFWLQILAPRLPQDESEFFHFLDELLHQPSFSLVLQIEGEKSFSLEARKRLGAWFQSNRTVLKQKCQSIIRLTDVEPDPLSLERMKRAMPCPYVERYVHTFGTHHSIKNEKKHFD